MANKSTGAIELAQDENPNEANPAAIAPSLTFSSITFSDGTVINLDSTDVVVLVGPNNAGKSLALRELHNSVGNPNSNRSVVTAVARRRSGSLQEVIAYLASNSEVSHDQNGNRFRGYRYNILERDLKRAWSRDEGLMRDVFCAAIDTESRISGGNHTDAIDFEHEQPSHPIHLLQADDALELKINGYFRQAFGYDLIVDRAAGGVVPLLVGTRLQPANGEDRISRSYIQRLRGSAVRLSDQGDGMRSFATVVLHLLAPSTQSVLLLDEPEAFLHPPQARLLGEIIAEETRTKSQLFVATHSPDVLQGLVNVAPENLRVLRMQREGNVNRIKELDKEFVKEISLDPLMMYSSVMSGVFHERVIICESDTDCMFYSSVLNLPSVRGPKQPDVLFVHGNGKDRMAKLATTLTALDVPVDVIADIDVLNDSAKFGAIVEALGGDPIQFMQLAESIKAAIEGEKQPLDSQQVKDAINGILEDVPAKDELPSGLRSKINTVFRESSPWAAVKRSGAAGIPPGQSTIHFQKLQNICAAIGLWIVPVGELEGFCKSVSGHGPKWVQMVLQMDLAEDIELENARSFVREIWMSRESRMED